MFKHSLKAKLTLAISIVLVLATSIIVILTAVWESRDIRADVDAEAAAWMDSAQRILSVTDVIMAERVKGAGARNTGHVTQPRRSLGSRSAVRRAIASGRLRLGGWRDGDRGRYGDLVRQAGR